MAPRKQQLTFLQFLNYYSWAYIIQFPNEGCMTVIKSLKTGIFFLGIKYESHNKKLWPIHCMCDKQIFQSNLRDLINYKFLYIFFGIDMLKRFFIIQVTSEEKEIKFRIMSVGDLLKINVLITTMMPKLKFNVK